MHKQLGWYFEFMVPIHVGAVGVHALKGKLMRRITPFLMPFQLPPPPVSMS